MRNFSLFFFGGIALFLFGILVALTIWRNSNPEISNLVLSSKVDADGKATNPSIAFLMPQDQDIFLSGKLSHTKKTKLTLDLKRNNETASSYPLIKEIETPGFPNNYFALKLESLDKNRWLGGDYELIISILGDKNPFKSKLKFKVIEERR